MLQKKVNVETLCKTWFVLFVFLSHDYLVVWTTMMANECSMITIYIYIYIYIYVYIWYILLYILRIYIDYIYMYVYIYIYHTNICSTYSSEVSSWQKLAQNVMLTRATIKIFWCTTETWSKCFSVIFYQCMPWGWISQNQLAFYNILDLVLPK